MLVFSDDVLCQDRYVWNPGQIYLTILNEADLLKNSAIELVMIICVQKKLVTLLLDELIKRILLR